MTSRSGTPRERRCAATPVGELAVGLSLAAMVAVPVALLWVGVRRRFRPALALGLLAALATAVSFADRLDLRPIWLGLVAGGAVLLGLAILARRFFAGRPGSEWSGLTTLALAEDRESAGTLEVAAVLATLSPAARQPEPGGFEGGGGELRWRRSVGEVLRRGRTAAPFSRRG